MMQSFKTDKLQLQVQHHLRSLIERGDFRPGERLPSEVELAAQLGVSRPTLREALSQLAQGGLIARKHGVGTFVSRHNPVLEAGLEVLESLERQARRIGLNVEIARLTVEERLATPREAEMLLLPQGEPAPVVCVDRVMAVVREPVAYLIDVVPQAYLRREDLEDGFSGSVLDLFLRRGTVQPVTSQAQISAEAAHAPVATQLEVPRGTALLKLVGQLYSYNGTVLDYSTSYLIPGYFKLYMTRRVERGTILADSAQYSGGLDNA